MFVWILAVKNVFENPEEISRRSSPSRRRKQQSANSSVVGNPEGVYLN
jgi:hypothetical protein